MMPFAFLQNIGTTELLIVAFVSLLMFGNRLPSVMRNLGKSVTEFKKGVSGIEEDMDEAINSDKKTTKEKLRGEDTGQSDQAVTADKKTTPPNP